MTDEELAALIKAQLNHALDLLRAELNAIRKEQAYDRELAGRRLAALEKDRDDHEGRIRDATNGVTQFRFLVGLTGSALVMAVIALVKSFLSR